MYLCTFASVNAYTTVVLGHSVSDQVVDGAMVSTGDYGASTVVCYFTEGHLTKNSYGMSLYVKTTSGTTLDSASSTTIYEEKTASYWTTYSGAIEHTHSVTTYEDAWE